MSVILSGLEVNVCPMTVWRDAQEQAENLGIDGGGGDDDTAMRYFGFSSRPVQAP